MDAHEVAYVGGPMHGERETRRGGVFSAPDQVVFPVVTHGTFSQAVYKMRPLADTPGAITYQYVEMREER